MWLREALLRNQAREVEAARAKDIETGQMLVKQLEVLGQENRALREATARASALERERETLLARLRLLMFAAVAALLLILIYLLSR